MKARSLVVRAVTLFLPLARPSANGERLRKARDTLFRLKGFLEALGFPVQTLRVALDGRFPLWGRSLEQVAAELGVLVETLGGEIFVSLGPVHTGFPQGYDWLPELLARYPVYASAHLVAPGEGHIEGQAVYAAARVIRRLAHVGPLGEGNTRFAATAWVKPGTPFFPAAYAAPQGPDWAWALAMETGGLLVQAARRSGAVQEKGVYLQRMLEEETRAIAVEMQAQSGELWERFLGFDVSWAPFATEDRSVGAALEALGLARVGGHGTLALAAWLTAILRRARLPRRTGFNGLMLPVLEDPALARAAARGDLDTRMLLVSSAVCGVGLDTVPLPGDVTEAQLAALLWDVAALAVRLQKPLAVRVMPIPGHGPGDRVRWDKEFFVDTPVLPLPGEGLPGWDESTVLDLGEG